MNESCSARYIHRIIDQQHSIHLHSPAHGWRSAFPFRTTTDKMISNVMMQSTWSTYHTTVEISDVNQSNGMVLKTADEYFSLECFLIYCTKHDSRFITRKILRFELHLDTMKCTHSASLVWFLCFCVRQFQFFISDWLIFQLTIFAYSKCFHLSSKSLFVHYLYEIFFHQHSKSFLFIANMFLSYYFGHLLQWTLLANDLNRPQVRLKNLQTPHKTKTIRIKIEIQPNPMAQRTLLFAASQMIYIIVVPQVQWINKQIWESAAHFVISFRALLFFCNTQNNSLTEQHTLKRINRNKKRAANWIIW